MMSTIDGDEDRIVELLRTHNAAMKQCMRFDVDASSKLAVGARKLAFRVEEELCHARPQTAPEALAALSFIQKEYMMDRLGEPMGLTDVAVVNLLKGVGEFIQKHAR